MNIWAHRGCSSLLPENTLASFAEACKYDITGIELDVQFSADKELVVIHDEYVDRTTDGTGEVRSFTLSELQSLNIRKSAGGADKQPSVCTEVTSSTRETPSAVAKDLRIPTLAEVLSLIRPYSILRGIKINIELKTGKFLYPGIEQATVRTVREFDMMDFVVFSSFNPKSIVLTRKYAPEAEVGFLARKLKNCARLSHLARGAALHPCITEFLPQITGSAVAQKTAPDNQEAAISSVIRPGVPIRVWSEPPIELLYPEPPEFPSIDVKALEAMGVTDLFTNVPERYCRLL